MRTRMLVILSILFLAASAQFGDSASSEISSYDIPEYVLTADDSCLSPTESELSFPRQSSVTNVPRTQTAAKRNITSGFSNCSAFVKSGKILNIQAKDLMMISSDLLPMGYTAGHGYLLSLGRLII